MKHAYAIIAQTNKGSCVIKVNLQQVVDGVDRQGQTGFDL